MANSVIKFSELSKSTILTPNDDIVVFTNVASVSNLQLITLTNFANSLIVSGYLVNTNQLAANLTIYQTRAGMPSNVAALTANNTSFVGSISSANVVSNSQLQANLTGYARLDGSNFTGYVNIANNVTVVGNLTVNGATTYINRNLVFVSDAINSTAANNAGITIGQYGNLVYNNVTNSFQSSLDITPASNNQNLGSSTKLWNLYANNLITKTFTTGDTGTGTGGFIANNTTIFVGNNAINASINTSSISIGSIFTANTTALYINNAIYLNGSNGQPGNVLVSNGTSNVYWSNVNTLVVVNTTAQYIWSNAHTFTNTIFINGISANGGYGTTGQVLTSNGSDTYWSTIDPYVNVNAQYVWANVHTFTNNIILKGVSANGGYGTTGQVLTTNGSNTYWSNVLTSVNTNARYYWTNNHSFQNVTTFTSLANVSSLNVINQTNTDTLYITTSANLGISVFANSLGVFTPNGTVIASSIIGGLLYPLDNDDIIDDYDDWRFIADTDAIYIKSPIYLGRNRGDSGERGQVLTSNGTNDVYWSDVNSLASVNTAARYTWTNTHSFNNTVTFNANVVFGGEAVVNSTGIYTTSINAASYTVGSKFIANTTALYVNTALYAQGLNGTAGQYLTSNGSQGVYWSGKGSSATANGYASLPGGLVLNWGWVSAGSSSGTVSFSSPYTTNAFSITTSVLNEEGYGEANESYSPFIVSFNKNGAQIRVPENEAHIVYWMAIGL